MSASVIYDDGGTTKTVTASSVTDGWGRVIQTVDVNGAQTNTSYDSMGRVASVTNPFTAGGSPSYSTSYSYDALGRTTTVTLPDGQAVTTEYNGNIVTTTDQVSRKTRQVKDGLGRVVTVYEQEATGSLNQPTNYTYNALCQLTQIDQGNQLRSYKYDAMSRLLYERIPEQTASINDGTGTLWTCKYTYTDFDAIATRTDARGVVTTYSYDTLNRLTQTSYNTVSGVTTAPTVTYTYDTDSGSGYSTTAQGRLLRINVGTDYQERYTFDSNYRIASTVHKIGTLTYTSSYNSYNEANQIKQMTYPSGRVLGVGYDNAGRVINLSQTSGGTTINYLHDVSYNLAGLVTGDILGNGVHEEFGYSSARLQLTTQHAGTSSPYTNRMDLTYSYSAAAGAMGVGSTAGNAGQLVGVSGTINSTTESASFTYDNLRRLVTSDERINGSKSEQRRFAYDRWGNRTGVWDATSGGTQIQSVSLQTATFTGGSAPTNRITSVTNVGVTVNYTYDAAGNVTNDGAHSYTYDSENRLVSVDSGAATYGYDASNRRYKKTIGGSVTHYSWEIGQVVAEHNGSTGAVLVDYLYSGARMVAKVASGTMNYFLRDRLSVRMMMDTSGAVVGRQGHLPFGEEFGASGTQQKQDFTSYERDSETATDYALNRQYNQGVGRFNRVDPYRGSNDNSDPQSFNRYAYVKNDPIGATDPLGLDELPPLGPKPDELIADPNTPNPMKWPDDFWWGGNPYSYDPNPYNGGGFFMTVPTPSFLDILNSILRSLNPGRLTANYIGT